MFAKIFGNGSKTKTARLVLGHFCYLNTGFNFRHLFALAVAHADHSICCYFLCAGYGYYVTINLQLNKSNRIAVGINLETHIFVGFVLI